MSEEDLDYVSEGSASDPELDVFDQCAGYESGKDKEREDIVDINRNIKGKRFEFGVKGNVELKENQIFVDVKEFRAILRDYLIQENFDVIRIKNEKSRVTAICAANGCPWRIHASPLPDGITYMIKSLKSEHTCIRESKKTNATSTWMAEKLESSLRADPSMSYDLMYTQINDSYGVQPHPMQLYRARCKARDEIEGKHAKSFKLIPQYARLLLDKNPSSIVKIDYWLRHSPNNTPTFKRLFICLYACKQGFLKGCRPFIGLDGCHLKGPYGGVLLIVVSLDANNGLFPIAFMVVEGENKDSWVYFLDCLHEGIGPGPAKQPFIFMSDRQKV